MTITYTGASVEFTKGIDSHLDGLRRKRVDAYSTSLLRLRRAAHLTYSRRSMEG